jgi:uncharacterized membrane protein
VTIDPVAAPVADIPEWTSDPPASARRAAQARSWIRRHAMAAASSPCTWLVLIAMTGYGAFATYQYQHLGPGVAAADLGIFYQAVQGWAFHGDPYVAIKGFSQLGDHFTPAWILLAPLLRLYNSPLSLVLAQVVLICLSAIPVYLAVRRILGAPLATALTAAYLAGSGLQHAIAFPVHEVMFAVPLIAWALERALAGRWTWAALLMCALSLVKEDLNLMILAFAAVALVHRKWRHAAVLALWAVAAYLLTIKVLIPAANPEGYTYLGAYSTTLHANNSVQAFWNLIAHPHHTLHLLFGAQAKRKLWLRLLAPVGFLALASPFGWLVLPNLISRLASNNTSQWTSLYHYDAPLMPILAIAAVDGLRRAALASGWAWRRVAGAPEGARPIIQQQRTLRLGGSALAFIALGMTAYLSDKSPLPLGRWLKDPSSYSAPAAWLADERAAVAAIPDGVTVQATNGLVVPIVARDTVTLVTDLPSGDWALIDTSNAGMSATDPSSYVAKLRSEGYATVRAEGPILVLHRSAERKP